MLVEEKYFSQDKNYLLKTVQAFVKESLLNVWVKQLFDAYNELHNPMMLEDDFIILLKSEIHKGKDLLDESYDVIAAVYRYYHSDNQLEFQWDGRSHMERYDEEWKAKFSEWVFALSRQKGIQRPVIKYATQGNGFNHDFLKGSIKRALLSHFNLRMRAQKLYQLSA